MAVCHSSLVRNRCDCTMHNTQIFGRCFIMKINSVDTFDNRENSWHNTIITHLQLFCLQVLRKSLSNLTQVQMAAVGSACVL